MKPVWVLHSGALGDFVLIWPFLRAIVRRPREAVVVVRGEHARLLAGVAGADGWAVPGGHLRTVDVEQREFNALWSGRVDRQVPGVSDVYTFVCDETTEAGRCWLGAAAAMYPGACVTPVGSPGSPSRAAAWAVEEVDATPRGPAGSNPDGPVVVHVGAGAEAKRWPLHRWAELLALLRQRGSDGAETIVIAGEVEMDRLSKEEHLAFSRMGGRFVRDLCELAAITRSAGVFVGADTGPTHLAAQLSVPTVALFGPTDPNVWGPVGPAVRVVRAGRMTDIEPASVLGAVESMRSPGSARP